MRRRSLPRPASFSSGEVIVVANEPKLGLRQHTLDECIAFFHPPRQLLLCVDRRIDNAAQRDRGWLQRAEQVGISQAVDRTPLCQDRQQPLADFGGSHVAIWQSHQFNRRTHHVLYCAPS